MIEYQPLCPVCNSLSDNRMTICVKCGFEDNIGLNANWVSIADADDWLKIVFSFRNVWCVNKKYEHLSMRCEELEKDTKQREIIINELNEKIKHLERLTTKRRVSNSKNPFLIKLHNERPTVLPNHLKVWDSDFGNDAIVVLNINERKIAFYVISSYEDINGIYMLTVGCETENIFCFKCTPYGDDEIFFEFIDENNDELNHVFNNLKAPFESLLLDANFRYGNLI
jgi:hypothetical protein